MSKLDKFLLEYRAFGRCEICRRPPDFRGMDGAHIRRRDYTGANDTIHNIVIACGRCHDHHKYANGLPMSEEAALQMVEHRNRTYGIYELALEKLGEGAVGQPSEGMASRQ